MTGAVGGSVATGGCASAGSGHAPSDSHSCVIPWQASAWISTTPEAGRRGFSSSRLGSGVEQHVFACFVQQDGVLVAQQEGASDPEARGAVWAEASDLPTQWEISNPDRAAIVSASVGGLTPSRLAQARR